MRAAWFMFGFYFSHWCDYFLGNQISRLEQWILILCFHRPYAKSGGYLSWGCFSSVNSNDDQDQGGERLFNQRSTHKDFFAYYQIPILYLRALSVRVVDTTFFIHKVLSSGWTPGQRDFLILANLWRRHHHLSCLKCLSIRDHSVVQSFL